MGKAPVTKINSKIQDNLVKTFAAAFKPLIKDNTEKINPYGSIRNTIINVHLKDL